MHPFILVDGIENHYSCFSNPSEHMQAADQVRGVCESRPGCGFRCCATRPSHCCNDSHAWQLSGGAGVRKKTRGMALWQCPVCGTEGNPMLLPAALLLQIFLGP